MPVEENPYSYFSRPVAITFSLNIRFGETFEIPPEFRLLLPAQIVRVQFGDHTLLIRKDTLDNIGNRHAELYPGVPLSFMFALGVLANMPEGEKPGESFRVQARAILRIVAPTNTLA